MGGTVIDEKVITFDQENLYSLIRHIFNINDKLRDENKQIKYNVFDKYHSDVINNHYSDLYKNEEIVVSHSLPELNDNVIIEYKRKISLDLS